MTLLGKLGFIGGGRMGEALIQGILKSEIIAAPDILVTDPVADRREYLAATYGIKTYDISADEHIWTTCGTVILAVKPQIMKDVLQEARAEVNDSHLLISIAAGIQSSFIDANLTGCNCRIIRVMPNTPAFVLEAASALCQGPRATQQDIDTALAIFNSIGKSVVLDEKYFDAVTGLSGSGPAYVFTFIEALIDAGLKVGLNRADAELLVMQTVLGSVKLAMSSNEHPAQLRAMVTSPGGTTIAGLHELEASGFNGIIMDAVEAATARSRELGK
ncbi:MAG: pyrroline-5-carboxylate reductase [Deltaproteobacteria bacterium]|jgi:pyrroline-5-carboxylate reductase|nr:pyrroline-5-carboxylate reductase [Deltaproteobacteria bacterium]